MFSRVICFWTALVVGSTILFSNAGAEPSRQNPDPVNGHRLAVLICSACHIAGPDQKDPPILRPPGISFQQLAKKEGISYDQIREFILTRASKRNAESDVARAGSKRYCSLHYQFATLAMSSRVN